MPGTGAAGAQCPRTGDVTAAANNIRILVILMPASATAGRWNAAETR